MSDSFGSSIEGFKPQPEIKKNINTVKIYFMQKVLSMKSRYRGNNKVNQQRWEQVPHKPQLGLPTKRK